MTVFQVNQQCFEPNVFQFAASLNSTTSLATANSVQQFSKWPDTLAEAMLLPGTRQWEAKDGVYSVVPFTSKPNTASYGTTTAPAIYRDSTYNPAPGSVTPGGNYMNILTPTITSGNHLSFPFSKVAPVHSKGAIITGMAATSRYTINVNFFVESFPDLSDQSTLLLATPSAQYDPVALEIISQITKELPIAVPVSENGFGDWFAGIVADIAPVLSGVALAMGHPELAALAGAAGAAAGTFRKKPKPKKPTNQSLPPPNSWGKPPSRLKQGPKSARTHKKVQANKARTKV